MLSAIVTNWVKRITSVQRILVCAPSNYAADLIAEKLHSIPLVSDKFIRFYAQKKEDIFNLNLETLKPYTLQSKILYIPEDMQSYFSG